MRIRFEPYAPEHAEALRRFTQRTWPRPRDPAFFRWRYQEWPGEPNVLMALRGAECVAMIGAFAVPYRLNGREVTLLQTHDWYCLPELRGSGLGIRVLQKMMGRKLPIVAAGGTEDTQALLPRLKWARIGTMETWVLPRSSRDLAEQLHAQRELPAPLARAAAAAATRTWFRPRAGSGRVQILEVSCVGDEVRGLYADGPDESLVALPDPPALRWLSGWAGSGRFVPLYFIEGGQLVGWALGAVREARAEGGGRRAMVLEAFAPGRGPDFHAWMIRALAERLDTYQPERITAWTSAPTVAEALHRARFLRVAEMPVNYWPGERGGELPGGDLRVGGLINDLPLLPYPEAWPPGGAITG